jgi:hypothetical protein
MTIQVNNSWNLPAVTANAADYLDLTETSAKGPRQADGSLPSNEFGRLVAGSDLIDKGVPVGLPFSGAAPDLGAFEFASGPLLLDAARSGWTNGGFRLWLNGVAGPATVILQASTDFKAWTAITTNAAANGTVQLLDATASNYAHRLYRCEQR